MWRSLFSKTKPSLFKQGDRVVIKHNFTLRGCKGKLICSLPQKGPEKSYLIQFTKPFLMYVQLESKDVTFLPENQEVVVSDRCLGKEQGCLGTIVQVLSNSRYLCEFDHSFYNIVLEEKDFVLFDPPNKFFSLLNTVKLSEDVPERGLKKGTKGVIILVYFVPYLAYEVEFHVGEDNDPPYVSYVFEGKQLEFVSEDCNG